MHQQTNYSVESLFPLKHNITPPTLLQRSSIAVEQRRAKLNTLAREKERESARVRKHIKNNKRSPTAAARAKPTPKKGERRRRLGNQPVVGANHERRGFGARTSRRPPRSTPSVSRDPRTKPAAASEFS